jgi:hypothetical protein
MSSSKTARDHHKERTTMDNKHKHTSLVGPSLLIGIGILFLLDNLGYMQWDFWQIIRFWPVLLVVWGLELLLQGRLLGRIISACIILIVILGGTWYLTTHNDLRPSSPIAYLKNDTASFIVTLKPSIAQVSIDAYTDSANLIGGDVSLPKGLHLTEEYTAGNRARLRLSTQPASRNWWPGQTEMWDLKLNGDTLLDMEVDLGVGDLNLNLSDLLVNKLTTDFGIATINIQLPTEGGHDITIDGGIGTLSLEIPIDTAVRITIDGGIVTKNFPPTYQRSNNVWTSPGYTESDDRVNVFISLGIGTIIVKNASNY